MTKKRILIFTDSRGQHKPDGMSHEIFPEKLAKRSDLEVESFLCPMKWTTTLDFLDRFPLTELHSYDRVILYTGIVDWSPRPLRSAINDLYNNDDPQNLEKFSASTTNYSKKVVNNKFEIFNAIFGRERMTEHFRQPYETEYEGQKTISMYTLEMASEALLPKLAKIQNLLYINANRFVPEWEGNFKRGRPKNITITQDYSDLFSRRLKASGSEIIDISSWQPDEVMSYTCDNVHLTDVGSDQIYTMISDALAADHQPSRRRMTISNAPRVSIIVPIYNSQKWLKDCVASIESQTFSDFETLLVDDGSTDKSKEICTDICALDRRFKYISQANAGLGPARNTGMDQARGEFITFVDSDDYISNDYLEALCEATDNWSVDIVSTMFYRTDENGKIIGPQKNFLADVNVEIAGTELNDGEKILGLFSSSVSCMRLFRRTILAKTGLRFPDRIPHEDWFFTYKAFLHANRTAYVKKPMYYWQVRSGSLSRTTTEAHIRSSILLFKDTEVFLKSITASEHLFNFGRRRSLSLLHQLSCRARATSPALEDHFYRAVAEELDAICDAYRHVDRQYLPSDLLQEVASIIELGARHRQQTDFSLRPGYAAFEKRFTETNDDEHERILMLRNCFKGERCFIIGNGPSLNECDLDLLRGEYTFGVNSFYLKTRDSGFLPTFFVVEDNKVMEENVSEIRSFPAPFKFFPTEYKSYDLAGKNSCFFSLDQGFYLKSKPYYGIPRFSVDVRDGIFAGQTVTYLNMQLAFYMGFHEVYLIGMDFSYYVPPEHKRKGNHILSTTDDPNHFHKDYFGKGKTWKDPQLDRVLLSYRMADIAYSAVGRKIYNATIGGRLEVFDRVDFEAMLRDPVTGKKRQRRIEPPITALGSMARQQGLANEPAVARISGSCAPAAATQLAADVLLDPVANLTKVEEGGEWGEAAKALIAVGGPAAEHFVKVRNWARAKVNARADE